MAASAPAVTVGRIIRPHGIKGRVIVESMTDFPEERFREGAVVFIERDGVRRPLKIVESGQHAGRWLVGFDGVVTMNDAEALRDAALEIPAGDVRALEAGRYYVHDLVGCRVETTRGEALGAVSRVDEMGGTSLLVVATRRGEVLVPLAETICREVDVTGRRIVIDPPPGLIDLNVTRATRDEAGPEGA